ncbi:MAG: TolC family protein, partial [Gammaproteobacteria bacterium]|nr:TolC family protein [Gammaproteobacteria bacterium]
VLADLVQAETMLDLASRATVDAERLLDITSMMESAGAAAQADVLQARTRFLQQRQSELQAQADLAIAERRYAILTGLSIKPDGALNEAPVANSLSSTHPTLKFLQSQVGIAAAGVALTRHQANGRPNLRFGVRRERGDRREPYIDTFGVTFSVPIGSSPAADASVSVARSQQVDAEVRMLQARRQLETRLRELEQELALSDELLTLGEDRVMISNQRYEMSLAAFEVGESDLTQVVLAQQQALQAQKDLATARLSQQRLISEYNQTMGVLP